MATVMIEGAPYPSGARMLTIHGKKAQIFAAGRTRHVVESRQVAGLTTVTTFFRTVDGAEYGFTTDEIVRAIFRS